MDSWKCWPVAWRRRGITKLEMLHWALVVVVSTGLLPVAWYFGQRAHVGAVLILVVTLLIIYAAVVFHVWYVMPILRTTIATSLATHAKVRSFQQVHTASIPRP